MTNVTLTDEQATLIKGLLLEANRGLGCLSLEEQSIWLEGKGTEQQHRTAMRELLITFEIVDQQY